MRLSFALLLTLGCAQVTHAATAPQPAPALAAAATEPAASPDAAPPAAQPAGARSQPLWEAGFFALGGSQQAYPGSRQQVGSGLVLPFFIYRGQVLRAEQGGVGLRALRTARMEFDVGLAGSFGSSASQDDARRGMRDIGTLIEIGPRVKWELGAAPWGGQLSAALPLRGVFDVSNGFGFRGVSLDPVLSWGNRTASGWAYGVNASLLMGNRRLTDTFYGVAPADATATRPVYEARAGLIATRLSVNLSRQLGDDWRVFGYARVDSVKGAANRNSPLVDRPTGASAGIGLSWTWLRSEQAAPP